MIQVTFNFRHAANPDAQWVKLTFTDSDMANKTIRDVTSADGWITFHPPGGTLHGFRRSDVVSYSSVEI